MIITSVTNLIYANQAETAINCELVTADLGMIPFTVTQNDPEEYGQRLWIEITGGQYGAISAYIAPPDLATQLAAALIANGTLQASDLQTTTLAQVNANLVLGGMAQIIPALNTAAPITSGIVGG